MKKFKKGSFVAISDFHSYRWPLEKVKDHYLNEYETIYILGDATDRGEYSDGSGGISLLLEIKKLSEQYPGRIVYLPGNHDDFLYQYAKYDDYNAHFECGCCGSIFSYERIVNPTYNMKLIKKSKIIEVLG